MRLYGALATLLLAFASPLLPAPWSVGLLIAAAVLWFRSHPRNVRPWWLSAGFLCAALVLSTQAFLAGGGESERWLGGAEERFDRFLGRFERQAEIAAGILGDEVANLPRGEAFRELRELSQRSREPALAYLLLDQDSEPVAWAGEGLLHDLEGAILPESGIDFIASYTTISVLAVRAVGAGVRPWRIVVGHTYDRETLPFDPGPGLDRRGCTWSLAFEGALLDEQGMVTVASAFGLTMIIDEAPEPLRLTPLFGWPWAAAILGLGFLLLVLTTMRGESQRRGEVGQRSLPLAAGLLATVSLFSTLGLSLQGFLVLGFSAVLAAVALVSSSSAQSRSRIGARFALGVAAIFLIGWWYQASTGTLDLGAHLLVGVEQLALRLSLLVVALGVFYVRPEARHETASLTSVVASFAALLAAAALHDRPLLSLPLLLIAAASAAAWVPLQRPVTGGRGTLVVLVFSAVVAATCWETSYRLILKQELPRRLEEGVRLPGSAELESWKAEIETFLQSAEARSLIRRRVDPEEMQDLAVALWRASPLARDDALSALVVDPVGASTSSFSYGLPLLDESLDEDALMGLLPVAARRELLLLEGSVDLDSEIEARFWLVPLHPIEASATGIDDIKIDLLRGGPLTGPRELEAETDVAVYDRSGSVIRTSLALSTDLPQSFEADGRGVATVENHGAWFWSRSEEQAVFRLYLPVLETLDGLERVGTHSLSSLTATSVAALLLLLMTLPGATLRMRLEGWIDSYSKRLVVVFTLMLLVPLLLLNLVLFRTMGDRLEAEHREAGEVSLYFAQRVLDNYLRTLPPGFVVLSVIDAEVLEWLSLIVQRDVNIYANGEFFASSKPELFTAGLLPERIPGDVYSSLVLEGASLASRTGSVGGVSYLELYAPLTLGGAQIFYLSTPLIAQEEQVATQLNQLARQAFLVTAALFLLLLAAGAALARSFTQPLLDIVEGTGRIAEGATSLGLGPRVPELASLVQAIDQMAGRIAAGREEILREKRVVEEVVQHITAGVVSLDAENRVLMHNRVASELLGVSTGQEMVAALEGRSDLEPVVAFLRQAGSKPRQTTVRLRGDDNEEIEWSLVWVTVSGPGEPSALFVVEDATEILRSQRLQAWAEMARMIAHEVKNPLTPIRLSTEHLKRVYAEDRGHLDEIFERCTENILEQVDELRQISREFSTYSQMPNIELRLGDLGELAQTITEAYRSSAASGVEVTLRRGQSRVEARFDRRLLGRALRNLLENAVRASGSEGEVELHVGQRNGEASLSVSDRGPGVPSPELTRIFEPYFSTHDSGTGLGLPIAKRIVEEHGGAISAHNRSGGGLTVRLTLPAPGAPESSLPD